MRDALATPAHHHRSQAHHHGIDAGDRNATAVLGGKFDDKGNVLLREPDFLVCCEGRWDILELGGNGAHTLQNAPRDHDRLGMFNDYGVTFHQFYPASRRYQAPEDVVSNFLARLARS